MELSLDIRLFLENVVSRECEGKSDEVIQEYSQETANLLKSKGYIKEITEEVKEAIFKHLKGNISKSMWNEETIDYSWIARRRRRKR